MAVSIDNGKPWWLAIDITAIPHEYKIDLQRFASAESEGRTEKATEHKKRKAREEGKVALSKDLPSTIVSLLCFIAIYFLGEYIYVTMKDLLEYSIKNSCKIDFTKDDIFYVFFLIPFIKLFAPIAAIAFVSALLSNYLQIGLKFTPKVIKPDLKKISPNVFKFLKNQVFSITGAFNLIKSIVKIIIIAIVAYYSMIGEIDNIENTMFIESILISFLFFVKLAFSIVIKILIILLVFSIIDYMFVKWQYEESLKMKKEEVKEEYKELYGDPLIRSRLKQMYQSMLSQKKMLEEVPKADVVITNPTHYAVALHYDRYTDEAPRVTAKGKDKFAQKIKEIAKENNVYMYENVMLARTLYNEVDINDVIPRTMYALVINAYKIAMQHKEKQTVG
jgi:flagellar biosynthetic protein FlhB